MRGEELSGHHALNGIARVHAGQKAEDRLALFLPRLRRNVLRIPASIHRLVYEKLIPIVRLTATQMLQVRVAGIQFIGWRGPFIAAPAKRLIAAVCLTGHLRSSLQSTVRLEALKHAAPNVLAGRHQLALRGSLDSVRQISRVSNIATTGGRTSALLGSNDNTDRRGV